MRKIPTCKKCGHDHYNISPCDEAAVSRVLTADAARRDRNLREPIRRPRPNDWGNKTPNTVDIAPGVVGLKRKPLHSMPRIYPS